MNLKNQKDCMATCKLSHGTKKQIDSTKLTIQEVFQIILEKDFHQIEGYEEFNYNFKNGIQEFFTKFWQVPQEKTTTYIERLV